MILINQIPILQELNSLSTALIELGKSEGEKIITIDSNNTYKCFKKGILSNYFNGKENSIVKNLTQKTNELMQLNDEMPVNFANKRVNPVSIVVKDTVLGNEYAETVDYIYNEWTDSITRIPEGNISDGEIVAVDYEYVDWILQEGRNIISMSPLRISDENIYNWIRVTGIGNTEYAVKTTTNDTMWDYSHVLPDKVLTVPAPELLDDAACHALADKLKSDMLERYISVNLTILPITKLQLRDVVQVLIYGLIREAYIITGISGNYEGSKATMTLKLHHYKFISL